MQNPGVSDVGRAGAEGELRVRGWQPTSESAEEAQLGCSGEQRKM